MKTERAPKRGREDLGWLKLSLVNDYDKYIGGVDCNDALIGNYTSVRKTYKSCNPFAKESSIKCFHTI